MGTARANRDIEIQIAVFNEMSTAMRHQSQAEYIYTAAAVAGYGGICLGVASLPPTIPVTWISWTAAAFIFILSFTIYEAISHNHGIYKRTQASRASVVLLLAASVKDSAFIPAVWKNPRKPTGVWRAYGILGVSTLGAAVFCIVRASAPVPIPSPPSAPHCRWRDRRRELALLESTARAAAARAQGIEVDRPS